jgi:hypothetical protein
MGSNHVVIFTHLSDLLYVLFPTIATFADIYISVYRTTPRSKGRSSCDMVQPVPFAAVRATHLNSSYFTTMSTFNGALISKSDQVASLVQVILFRLAKQVIFPARINLR